MKTPKPIGRIWNASQRWAKNIYSHQHMISICLTCDLDDELYVRDYKQQTKEWTTPRKMGYENVSRKL